MSVSWLEQPSAIVICVYHELWKWVRSDLPTDTDKPINTSLMNSWYYIEGVCMNYFSVNNKLEMNSNLEDNPVFFFFF